MSRAVIKDGKSAKKNNLKMEKDTMIRNEACANGVRHSGGLGEGVPAAALPSAHDTAARCKGSAARTLPLWAGYPTCCFFQE